MKKITMLMGAVSLIALMSLSNCKSSQIQTNQVTAGKLNFDKLKRSDYKVIGNVTATIEVKRVLGFYIGAEKQGSYISTNPNEVHGLSVPDKVAIYSALSQVPEADAVIFPRFERRVFSVFPFFSRTNVTVKAKAISINTDSEVSGTTAEETTTEKTNGQ